jgi:predicted DNA-binding ribbon-helix-helix protein
MMYTKQDRAMSASEVRTQIYLPRALHRALGQAARRRGVSMAQLLREGAEIVLREEAGEPTDPLASLIGIVKGGPADLSENHDRYLHQERRKK